jgi:hypothetical protein
VRRRRLASELRRLREAAGLTIEEVGEKLECSASKISRMETGHVGVNPRDARDVLDLYGLVDDERESLVQLARQARQKGWWHAYNDVFTGALVGLESEASSLRAFQALLVPALVQTREYAYATLKGIRPDAADEEVQRHVDGRMARQSLITGTDPPRYWAVMDEAVLHREVGGSAVRKRQLEHLLEMAKLPHVTMQVLPFAAGEHCGLEGPFLILRFDDQADSDVVYVENTISAVYLEKPSDVDRYVLMFDHLRASALPPEASLDLIADLSGR